MDLDKIDEEVLVVQMDLDCYVDLVLWIKNLAPYCMISYLLVEGAS